jgi:hypothetical protein
MTRLQDANRYDMKLSNGVLLGYRLPQMREMVMARLLPLAALDAAKAQLEEGASAEEAGAALPPSRSSSADSEPASSTPAGPRPSADRF